MAKGQKKKTKTGHSRKPTRLEDLGPASDPKGGVLACAIEDTLPAKQVLMDALLQKVRIPGSS